MEKSIVLTAIYYGNGEYVVFKENISYPGEHESYSIYIDEDFIKKPCSTETTNYILGELGKSISTKGIECVRYFTNSSTTLSELGEWYQIGLEAKPVMIQDCDLYGNPIPYTNSVKHLQLTNPYNPYSTQYIPIDKCNDLQSVGRVLQDEPRVDSTAFINFANVEDGMRDGYHGTQTRMVNNELIIPATFEPRPNRSVPTNDQQSGFHSPNISVTNDGIKGGFKIGPFSINASFGW